MSKVIFDEGVPEDLAKHLLGHDVSSVGGLGWKGTRNGRLLAKIQAAGFDALVTNDKRMKAEQQLQRQTFAIFVLSATNWPDVKPYVHKIAEALEICEPGTVTMIECGKFVPKKFRRPAM